MVTMDFSPVLYPFNPTEVDIRVDRREFLIGRAKNASYDIKDLSISRNQCVIAHREQWTVCDKSSAGTWLNRKKLKQNLEVPLNDGDHIRLGETEKYNYIFCNRGKECPNSCWTRASNSKAGLDAEMAQRRRLFDYKASLEKDGLEKCILEKQHDRHKLEQQQRMLRDNFNDQLLKLEERNRQLHSDLEKKSNSLGDNLLEERERLKKQLSEEKQKLEDVHTKETSELACKISAFEAAESELKKQNQALLERLEQEKQQFESRLEEERMVLQAKFAEQLAEQQKLAAEKSQVEEALRTRIQDLEKIAHQDQEQQQQRQVERQQEEERLAKEKMECEKRLEELQRALEEKERLEIEREKIFQERDLELKAQEEQRERERIEREARMEAEFLAKKKELEQLERERQEALDKHKEEVTKELQDREAELKRKAEEHERELEEQKAKEHEKLRKELEEKEEAMRRKLEWEMIKLQEEKVAIEMNIRGELSKKEGENAEILGKLKSELDQVKKDLDSTSSKRTLLERQLEEASQAKEAASKNELEARKAVIDNFGDLVESELQCSICSELFVSATTLNCNHTFCQMCINNWLDQPKTRKECPICRALVKQQTRSLVLDSFIDRMVDNLSEDMKQRRTEIVEERRVLSHVSSLVANPNKRRKTTQQAPPAIPNVPPQAVNHNVLGVNGVRVVPVAAGSVPAGAPVIHIPAAAPSTIDLTRDSPSGAGRGLSAAQAAAIAARAPTLGPPILISSDDDSSDGDSSRSHTDSY